ncbi:MAG: hybrid sensor histidine kinase/response regulator, partial [Firmicutes bacterium HGW-Firmicutes-12]
MRIKNLKIGTQLKIGFVAMLFFVIVLGLVAFMQTDKLHQQTEKLYNHPLKVRNVLDSITIDILTIRVGMRDLLLATSDQEEQANIQLMTLYAADIENNFDILKDSYLGPAADVEEAYQAYLIWENAVEESIKLVNSGEIEKVKESIHTEGTMGSLREKMLVSINNMDVFAQNMGDALYKNSVELNDTLNRQLVLLTATILLLSLLISYSLLRNIRKPLKEMNDAVLRFHRGDMDARSSYETKNEFGLLSSSINFLADMVQENINLNKKRASLAEVMLSEDDARSFFQATLATLADHTGSQIAAVYLLSEDKKTFEHYESLGLDNNIKQSFAADSFEGEFGAALFAQKLQHIQNIPEDTRFVFHTVNGRFIPRGIITIPIISGNQVIAIISLATVSNFTPHSIALLDIIRVTLSARIEGILSYRRIKDIKEKVEQQNRDLNAHKAELSEQAAELMQQNTELEMQKKLLDDASR